MKLPRIPLRWRCWFSARFWDVHDYHTWAGGDGTPSHFYTYNCSRCDKAFII